PPSPELHEHFRLRWTSAILTRAGFPALSRTARLFGRFRRRRQAIGTSQSRNRSQLEMDANHNNSQAHEEQTQPEESGPRRVLIVEDEAIIAMYVEDVISRFGYSVAGVVSNVDEALAFIEPHAVDAAVLDLNLKRQLV